MPYQPKGHQGTCYQFDIAKVIQWRIDRLIERDTPGIEARPKDKDDLARSKLLAETEIAELKPQKLKDSLVTVEEAQEVISEAAEALSEQLRTIPATIAPLVLNQMDEHQVAQVIAGVIDQTLIKVRHAFITKKV